jgi:hypothetical protein
MTAVRAWTYRLGERSLPHFNQLVVWLLLASAGIVACLPFTIREGPRQGPTTLISWLPDAILASPWMFLLLRAALVVGIVLWLLQRWLPWSCWLATLGITGLWSLHVENTYNTSHIFHMTNMLLVIQSFFITADAALVKRAISQGNYWRTPLVPRWVSLASIAYIGIFHTAAGLSKLWFSGPGWANGTSLQLWAYLFGYEWSPARELMINSRTLTAWMQVATLVVETSGVLAVVPRLRTLVGLALVGFYVGVIVTFPYGFALNALFTAVYLLPLEPWITAWAVANTSRQQPTAENSPPLPPA